MIELKERRFYSIAYRNHSGVINRVNGRLQKATAESLVLSSSKGKVRTISIVPMGRIVEISNFKINQKQKGKGIYYV